MCEQERKAIAKPMEILQWQSDAGPVGLAVAGTFAASLHLNGELRFWDLLEGRITKTIGTLPTTASTISGVALSSDAHEVAACIDRELVVFETATGRELRRTRLQCNGLWSIRFRWPWVAIAQRDEGLRLVDLTTLADRWQTRVSHHSMRPNQLSVSPSMDSVLSLSLHADEYRLRVWDGLSGSCRLELQGFDGCFAIENDDRFGYSGRYCSAADRHSIVRFRLDTGKFVDSFQLVNDDATALAISPDRSTLVIGTRRGQLHAVGFDRYGDRFDFHSQRRLGEHCDKITDVVVTCDSQYAMTVTKTEIGMFKILIP